MSTKGSYGKMDEKMYKKSVANYITMKNRIRIEEIGLTHLHLSNR